MNRRTREIPDLLIEQLALGELAPLAAESLESELELGPDADLRLEELRRSDRAVLRDYPPTLVINQVLERHRALRSHTGRRTLLRLGLATAPLAAAVGLVLLVGQPAHVPALDHPGPPAGVEQTRVKGARPHLLIHRQHGQEAELLFDSSQARAGDLVQIGYVAADALFGAVLSIDGRGAVTLHLPERSAVAARLTSSGEALLPFAYELDDAPAFERFVLITAPRPFALERVVAAASAIAADPGEARAARLALPEGFEQHSITLTKVAP